MFLFLSLKSISMPLGEEKKSGQKCGCLQFLSENVYHTANGLGTHSKSLFMMHINLNEQTLNTQFLPDERGLCALRIQLKQLSPAVSANQGLIRHLLSSYR